MRSSEGNSWCRLGCSVTSSRAQTLSTIPLVSLPQPLSSCCFQCQWPLYLWTIPFLCRTEVLTMWPFISEASLTRDSQYMFARILLAQTAPHRQGGSFQRSGVSQYLAWAYCCLKTTGDVWPGKKGRTHVSSAMTRAAATMCFSSQVKRTQEAFANCAITGWAWQRQRWRSPGHYCTCIFLVSFYYFLQFHI